MIKKLLFTVFLLVGFSTVFAQDKPAVSFEELMLSTERNPAQIVQARQLTAEQNIPHTIYLPQGIFIEAKGIENEQVVYTIINDLLHPFNGGEVAYYSEIQSRYDLSSARIHWINKPTQNPTLGYQFSQQQTLAVYRLMVPESTTDATMSFNPFDGSLISMTFLPGGDPNLSTPIEANLTPGGTIIISDQITDQIAEFDTLGVFVRTLFGGSLDTLDNCRGNTLSPGLNSVMACIGGGTNQDAIAEFDLSTGNFIGNFITPNTTFMDSPFDIIFRASDCLVSASSSNDITRYDLSGNHLGDFVPSISFPEQLYETASGNVLAAGFSSPSGLYIYDSNGTQLNYFNAVTGLRGVYQLGNGNYMVTSGTGVHILDGTSGNLISTPVSGVSGRFISDFDPDILPVELTSFSAKTTESGITLSWQTATETNNSGFSIERGLNKNNFETIGFVTGFGTTSETQNYSFVDNNVAVGTYYYRLKQIDFDGSFEYSGTIEVDFTGPTKFSLLQNYPNPFNPTTTLQFTLPADASVMLNVYNLVGEKVAEVINEELAAGLHKIQFNGENLSSGLYLYKLNVFGKDGSNYSAVKKMTLLK
jgi:hypothetical protein